MSNKIIVFDTETTGFSPNKAEIVQLSYILYDLDERKVDYATEEGEDIVGITGEIPERTSDVHGIKKKMTEGKRPIKEHIDEFIMYFNKARTFVGHNISFDIRMIVGQIKKIIDKHPTERSTYEEFLSRFDMVEKVVECKTKSKTTMKTKKVLQDNAYCTMNESKGDNKGQKLIEVHKRLFKQDVGGQLHNALVDISVTLRIYLKLTKEIDICESMSTDDHETICNIINPTPITLEIKTITPEIKTITPEIKPIDYSGDVITGIEKTPSGLVENTINLETMAKEMAKEMATNFVSDLSSFVTKKHIIKKESKSFVSRIFSDITKKGITRKNNTVAPSGTPRGSPTKKNTPPKKDTHRHTRSKVVPMGGRRKKRSVKKENRIY
jgi:DNA polymerase III epsilon subunit-like protein